MDTAKNKVYPVHACFWFDNLVEIDFAWLTPTTIGQQTLSRSQDYQMKASPQNNETKVGPKEEN